MSNPIDTTAVVTSTTQKGLVQKLAEKFGVDQQMFYNTLKSTAFKQRDGSAPSNEQMMTLLVVADQYGLNPFVKEIYAFPDKNNGIIPVVGVDGWSRIINSHPKFNGVEFDYSDGYITVDEHHKKSHEWIECKIYRTDRDKPIVIREFFDEVYRPPFIKNGTPIAGPWQTHSKRFHRHKTLIQTARLAFGFAGIYDQDEAERIVEQRERDLGTIDTKGNPVAKSMGSPLPNELPPPPSDDEVSGNLRLQTCNLVKRSYQQGVEACKQWAYERFTDPLDLAYVLSKLNTVDSTMATA